MPQSAAYNIQTCIAQKSLSERILRQFTNFKKTSKSRYTRGLLETRIETLDDYWQTYKKQHNDIILHIPSDALAQISFDPLENFNSTEDTYLELKTILKECLGQLNNMEQKSNPLTTCNTDPIEQPKRLTKLPPINIPQFSGDYLQWLSFRDIFTSLIRNDQSLSDVEKYHYLKSNITGEAEQLLKNFAVTSANYEKAWQILEDRYNNKRVIVNNIINRLLNQKKITFECARALRELLDTTQQCLHTLQNIGIETDTWDAIVVHIVVSKLDMESHKLWEQSIGSSTDIPSFKSLASHLENRFRSLEMVNFSKRETLKRDTSKPNVISKSITHKPHVQSFVTEATSICTYCSQNHYVCHCKEFANLDVTARRQFVNKNNICFNCLVKGHKVANCRQSSCCKKCGRRHHSMLHITYPVKPLTNSVEENPAATGNTVSLKTEIDSTQVILATAQITVKAKNGNIYILRALIDQGSQASFVTEAAAQLLQLDRIQVNGKIHGISDTAVVNTRSMVNLTIHTRNELSSLEIEAYVLKRLTSLLPTREFSRESWPSTMQLDLADPNFHKPSSIDVLLGADVHAKIILPGIHKHGSLVAVNTSLGWLISGKVTHTETQNHVNVTHFKLELDQLLRRFWEMEEEFPNKRPLSQLEIKCENHFKITHTRNDDGRYVLRLPFAEDTPTCLGDSRSIALNRLYRMERLFTRDADLKKQYTKFMIEYLDNGHMEAVPKRELISKKVYYLPHHAVLRPMSLSTKLRVVFDGTAAPKNGKALNEELLVGPPLLQDIRDLITRWRQHKFCLVADIQKMFRQILISREDIDYQRILWRESSKDPVTEYRLLTVTYGTSSAPFLAVRTLHQLAEDEGKNFPREAEIIKNDIYMDDLMTGSSTADEAIRLQRGLSEILQRGGFPLHKWSSNSESVLNHIPDNSKELNGKLNIKVKDTIKTLGITWNSQTDSFELKLNLEKCYDSITKRNVLSTIAKTFDPLGWLAPSIILLKVFMQKLWLAGLGWDEELTPELKTEWFSYLDNFNNVKNILFPRWLGLSNITTKIEIHGFSDASCAAYACVLYLRVWEGNQIKVYLIAAKARVSPVKQLSIPRLELCGSVLLAKMLHSVKHLLKIPDSQVYAWTDSTIVLAWLKKPPNTWTTFVANRTAEILTLTNNSQWHHVESINNPADLASRGLYPSDLQSSRLWWSGPDFLSKPIDIITDNLKLPETEIELKRKIVTNLCSIDNNNFADTYLTRFSKLSRLIHVTAYCLRFFNNCKFKLRSNNKNCNTYLTAPEIKNGMNVCIRLSQFKEFNDEINLLSQGKCVSKKSKLYTLSPYLDSNNLLRVGGRLANAEVPTYLKSPIILSNHSPLSKLIISSAHEKTLHGGNQLTLNHVRQKFWIIRVKNLVKSVLRKCITCFKFRATPNLPLMGNLPEYRIKPSRPFLTSGVDFAGPFTLKLYPGRCKKFTQAYICLFICTVTKAIHLEVVTDLTSAAFLAAFRRFTSRRGHCKEMWSDCGTNFKGASRELDVTFKNLKSQVVAEVGELLANDQTVWNFIPPNSPHFGGLWEAGVKSVKGHIKRVVGQTILTYEEFSTLLTQVEACVNSRPLTLMSSSPDQAPLTPGHFLIGEAPVAVAEESLIDVKLSPLDRWNMIQKMVQCLWQRWQLEYLTNLQNRYKWSKTAPDIELGAVVLVKDDRLPPGKWLLGRVTAKHPGADGITRVVTLQYKDKSFKRPVVKLCPLPLND